MSADQVNLLEQFVKLCKDNPALLHQPQFSFYREYLESLGAKIPPSSSTSEKVEEQEQEQEDDGGKESPVLEEEDEPELSLPELDNSGIVDDQTGELKLLMGDPDKEISEDDQERANEDRDIAMAAFSEGDYQKALDHFTKAIERNPGSAILHAKRANTLLKMYKLKAAIQDCDKAISINPDSAQPYKFRGRAHRFLGNWMEAHRDLAMSCKLDYDETAYEWLKEVEPNAKKLQEYERARQRHMEEKELREKRERVRRAQEANKKAKKEDSGMNFNFNANDMGPFSELFKDLADDPELMDAIKNDPSLIQKIMEIMQNPASMMKHMSDPNVQKLLGKLGSKFGGMAGASPFTSEDAATGDAKKEATTGAGTATTPPKKAPEPALD